MAGTKAGGIKCAQTNKAKYGDDYYEQLAYKSQAKWIENGRKPRGFAKNIELARRAGKAGGLSNAQRRRA